MRYHDLPDHVRTQIVGFGFQDDSFIEKIDHTRDRNDVVVVLINRLARDTVMSTLRHQQIDVVGYRKMPIDRTRLFPLDDLLAQMDEEYHLEGVENPNIGAPYDAMRKAETVFVDAVMANYVVERLDPVCVDTIRIGEFLKRMQE